MENKNTDWEDCELDLLIDIVEETTETHPSLESLLETLKEEKEDYDKSHIQRGEPMKFKPTIKYGWDEQFALVKKYRLNGDECNCSSTARQWYEKGVSYNKIGEKYGTRDYHYFFYNDGQQSSFDQEKEKEFFLKAIECFRHAAEEGHDIAMTIYGLYIFHFCEIGRRVEAFEWFKKASDKGLAIGDYAVACCYYKGYGTERSQKQGAIYFHQFIKRWENDLRQRALALHMDFDKSLPFTGMLYTWCSGDSYIGCYDLPGYLPHGWMITTQPFGEPNFEINLDTDVMKDVPGDEYFLEYYYM